MLEEPEIVKHLRRVTKRRSIYPPTSVVGVLGSSRKNGNTRMLTDAVLHHLDSARLFDLSDLSIAPYDYDDAQTQDDFLPLAEQMAQSQMIIFASPIYWYSMSAQMKVFFDRLTDLTKTHKMLGRSLADKTVCVIATSTSKTPPSSFEAPFAKTAGYFGMQWGGMLHGSFEEDRQMTPELNASAATFAEKIKSALQAPCALSTPPPIAP